MAIIGDMLKFNFNELNIKNEKIQSTCKGKGKIIDKIEDTTNLLKN